jgi:hypothetical protein
VTARVFHGDGFTALTVTDASGACLNVERTDDGNLSAWIAPPGGNDGHSVRLDAADVIALTAYVSADVQGALVPAAGVKHWYDRYANAQNALRNLAQAYTDATGKPAPEAVAAR